MSKDTPFPHEVTHSFPNGITVAELKRIVAEWPETNAEGDPALVYSYDDAGRAGQVRFIEAEEMTKSGGKFDLMLDVDGGP